MKAQSVLQPHSHDTHIKMSNLNHKWLHFARVRYLNMATIGLARSVVGYHKPKVLRTGDSSAPPQPPSKRKEELVGPPPSKCKGPAGFALHPLLTTGSLDADASRKSAGRSGPDSIKMNGVEARPAIPTFILFLFGAKCNSYLGRGCLTPPNMGLRTQELRDCTDCTSR